MNGNGKKRYGNRKKVKAPSSISKPKKAVEKTVSMRGGSGGVHLSYNRYNPSSGRSTSYGGSATQHSTGARLSTSGRRGTTFSASIDKPYQGKPNVSAGVTFQIGRLRNKKSKR